jgi:hypothetical protein
MSAMRTNWSGVALRRTGVATVGRRVPPRYSMSSSDIRPPYTRARRFASTSVGSTIAITVETQGGSRATRAVELTAFETGCGTLVGAELGP